MVFDDVLLIDVVGPSDVFGRANNLLVRTGQPERYRITVLSTFGGEIRAAGGLRLQTAALPPPAICAFDTVLVAGGPGVQKARRDMQLLNWIRAVEPGVQRLGSVCTGAYVVAEAGLLTGKSATTHWRYEGDFAAQFPQVRLNIDAMFVRDGKLFSSAGGAAGIDLALSLVDEDFGRDLAAEIASDLVVSNVRAAGQTQHSAALASYGSTSDKVQRATDLILSRPGQRHHRGTGGRPCRTQHAAAGAQVRRVAARDTDPLHRLRARAARARTGVGHTAADGEDRPALRIFRAGAAQAGVPQGDREHAGGLQEEPRRRRTLGSGGLMQRLPVLDGLDIWRILACVCHLRQG